MSFRILNLCAVGALGGTLGALILASSGSADLLSVPAPCATSGSTSAVGTSGAGGLRFCKDYLYAPAASPTPGLLATIYNNVAAPTTPGAPDNRGTIQKYVSCYYQGYELDASQPATSYTITPTTNVCTLGNPAHVHNMCSIVGNHLNNNASEGSGSGGATPANMAGTTCGSFANVSVQFLDQCPTPAIPNPPLTVPSPTASQAALLSRLGLTISQITSPTSNVDVSALATNVSAAQAQQLSGKKACISYNLPQPNPAATPADPSWERNEMSGAYILALSSNTDEVLNEISCQQSLSIDTNGACYLQAQQVLGLMSQLQSATAQLGQAANIGDIDYCQAMFTGASPTPAATSGAVSSATAASLTGNLRQSAQYLCSARSKLEAAYGQLAMCDIFSRTQSDWLTKGPYVSSLGTTAGLGTVAGQLQFMTNMTTILDNGSLTASPTSHAGVCGTQCKGKSSTSSLQSCMQSCYNANVQQYFQSTLTSSLYWPQPTPLSNTSCVPGGQPYANF